MKDLVIIGKGSFAELLYYYLTEYGEYNAVAFSVNTDYILDPAETFCGLPVTPLEALAERYPPEQFEVILGVGYSDMNNVRKNLFFQCKEMGYHIASYIHPSAWIPDRGAGGARLGEGNIILEHTVVEPFVTMGDGNLIWCAVKVGHGSKLGSFNTLAGNTSLSGMVTIGDNCFLGNSCVLHDKITLADYTLVGAGACVAKSSAPYDVIVPPRAITLEEKKSTDFL